MAVFSETPTFVYVESDVFKTLVSKFESGHTQRRAKWSAGLHKFKLEFKNVKLATFQAIQDFFQARQGMYESFSWVNPNDSVSYTVCFADDELEYREVGYQVYDVSFRLEEVR